MKSFIKTETINNGRYYVFGEDKTITKYPSVTTILGATGDKTWLEEWRKNIGPENADRISKFSANRGTVMHIYGEIYLDECVSERKSLKEVLIESYNRSIKEGFSEKEIKVGRDLFFNFYNTKAFDKMKRVIMQEDALYNDVEGGYAGRVDFIYEDILNDVIIADFKSSKKPKSECNIEDYKMQLSAYCAAYAKLTKIVPRYGEIWISNEQYSEPQIIIVSKLELEKYYKMFIDRVKLYHSMYKI